METRPVSITVSIGNSWWKLSVVGGKSAPWLVWRSGHVLPGRYHKSGFRIDIGSTGTCLQPCLPAGREVYVRGNVREINVKYSNQ